MKKSAAALAAVFVVIILAPGIHCLERGPMKPIAPLMIEHRQIEGMLMVMEKATAKIKTSGHVEPAFIAAVIDFIVIYGDKTHHGKEEAILFAELAKKKLSAEHKRMMDELVEAHRAARRLVDSLAAANKDYAGGNTAALSQIAAILEKMTALYHAHILKEDRQFFLPAMDYFSKAEQDEMLGRMREYDRQMIHVKYKQVVQDWAKRYSP
jgi:hemerythrin-like domain-containing protein